MTTKRKAITPEKAEERFKKNALSDAIETHNPIVEWENDFYQDQIYDPTTRKYVPKKDAAKQQKFKLKCSNTKCDDGLFRSWGDNYVNKNGTIGASYMSSWNRHILHIESERVAKTVTRESALVMEVTMRRGGNHQYWVAHMNDTDFWDGCKIQPYINTRYPWKMVWRDTRGWKPAYGGYTTRDEAVAEALKRRLKYVEKGYVVTVMDGTESGVVPVAATVAISVRKLIDDYKDLGDAARKNPGKVKPWLDKANDALTQLELLEQLRDEVQNDMMEALIL